MMHYAGVFKPTEIQMMLSAFSNMATIITEYSKASTQGTWEEAFE